MIESFPEGSTYHFLRFITEMAFLLDDAWIPNVLFGWPALSLVGKDIGVQVNASIV